MFLAKFFFLIVTVATLNADTIEDIENRKKNYIKFMNQTSDPRLKQLWKDKADLESASIFFNKKIDNLRKKKK